jgi:hypothetical protein
MGKVFVGVDPGQTGGLGILDCQGGYLACWRWNSKDPASLYNKLLLFKDLIKVVYLEDVRIFPGEGGARATQTQSLLVNQGIWQGFLLALGLTYLIIHPHTWQAVHGLRNWQKLQEKNPAHPSPLTKARAIWPNAPLEFGADDGKAAALFLAHLALEDTCRGFDRAASQAVSAEKNQKRKKAIRLAKKQSKALQF